MAAGNKRNEDPAEGSRETIERELARSGKDRNGSGAGKQDGAQNPKQPDRDGKRERTDKQ